MIVPAEIADRLTVATDDEVRAAYRATGELDDSYADAVITIVRGDFGPVD